MKVLVTGNNGYIGTVLVKILIEKGYNVVGLDTNYFEECRLEKLDKQCEQINIDIRYLNEAHLKGIDTVIHLAGLSNDPLGELAPNLTKDINYKGTIELAKLSKKMGVSRFIYASSQSMYGISDTSDELEEDNSLKNPVTSYASTKWDAEQELSLLKHDEFMVVSFRPSTVFGYSPRLRCDIVFNNLVACAYTTGKIEILSDGSPWRPVIHVRDVCSAFIAGIEAPKDKINGKAYNVGIQDGNYTVRQLAEVAQMVVPGSELIFKNEHTDPRTYKVSFRRILNELKEYYKPNWDLEKGGIELVDKFREIKFSYEQFKGVKCNRLQQLENLQADKRINKELMWIK